MDFLELVQQARTCRRFAGKEPLPAGTLEWLANCARQAPSAGNKQPLRYALVEDRDVRERIYPALRWAGALKDWDGPEPDERPTGYMAMLSPAGDTSLLTRIDVGIAAQTIQLAAASRGLACCMFLSFTPEMVTEVLEIPAGYQVSLMLALGHPVEERRIVPMPEQGDAPYWRDAAGVHYVPKRSLDEVVIIRR